MRTWPLLLLAVSPALASTLVFERVEPVEVRSGVVRLCAVQAPLLDVPDLETRSPRPDGWREARFARLYSLEFELETRTREGIEQEDRGTLSLAVRTGSDELLALDDRLRSLLLFLGPDAFSRPLAGIDEGLTDFLFLAEISTEPSWGCSRKGGRGSVSTATMYSRQMEGGSVLGTSTARFSEEHRAGKLCESLLQSAQGCAFEEIRTLPVPRELHELRVEMEEASTLPKEMRSEDLLPLPPGVTLSKARSPGGWSGKSLTADGTAGSYLDREVEWTVRTAPSSLPLELLARGAHVSRWSLRERTRLTGAHPRDDVRTAAQRTVAFLPVAPPAFPDEPPPATLAIQFSAEQLRDDVAEALDAGSQIDGALLEAALRGEPVQGPQWLQSEGWMTVLCRDDGTAWFGLPPTAARSPVTNAAVFCAAMERMLPSP